MAVGFLEPNLVTGFGAVGLPTTLEGDLGGVLVVVLATGGLPAFALETATLLPLPFLAVLVLAGFVLLLVATS